MSTVIDLLLGGENVTVNNITAATGHFETVETVNATSYNFTEDLTIQGGLTVGDGMFAEAMSVGNGQSPYQVAAKRKEHHDDDGPSAKRKKGEISAQALTYFPAGPSTVVAEKASIQHAKIGLCNTETLTADAIVCDDLTALRFVLPDTGDIPNLTSDIITVATRIEAPNILVSNTTRSRTTDGLYAAFNTLDVFSDPLDNVPDPQNGRIIADSIQSRGVLIGDSIVTDAADFQQSLTVGGVVPSLQVVGEVTTARDIQCPHITAHTNENDAELVADIGTIGQLTTVGMFSDRITIDSIAAASKINKLDCEHSIVAHNETDTAVITTDVLNVANTAEIYDLECQFIRAPTIEAKTGLSTMNATYMNCLKAGEVGGDLHATNIEVDAEATFNADIDVAGVVNAGSVAVSGPVSCENVTLTGLGGIFAGLGPLACGSVNAATINCALVTCIGVISAAGVSAPSFTTTGAVTGNAVVAGILGVSSVGPISGSVVSAVFSMQAPLGNFTNLEIGEGGITTSGNCVVATYATIGTYITVGGNATFSGMVSCGGDLDVGDVITCQDLVAVGDVVATNISATNLNTDTFILSGHVSAFDTISAIVNATPGYVTITTTSSHGLTVGQQVHIVDSNSTPTVDGYRFVSEVVSPTMYRVPATTLTVVGNAGKSYKTGESRINGSLVVTDTLTAQNSIVCDDLNATNAVTAPYIQAADFANALVAPTFSVSSIGNVVANDIAAADITADSLVVSAITPTAGALQVLGDLELTGKLVLPAWVAMSLVGGFSNYGAGWDNAAYVIDATGKVCLRGLIGGAAISATGFGTQVAVLPTGYRPTNNKVLVTRALLDTGANIAVTAFIYSTGAVFMLAQTAGNATWISLDPLSFYK